MLVGSDDYGRDLTGVQNLRKKHKRLESELASHEPTIQVHRKIILNIVICSFGFIGIILFRKTDLVRINLIASLMQ